jgi:hypothetical protein
MFMSMHPGVDRAFATFDAPGSLPTSRRSVRPLTAVVTRPPNCSHNLRALSFPRLSPQPPPSSGKTPVRTIVFPASWRCGATPPSALRTIAAAAALFFGPFAGTATTALPEA